MEQPSKKPLDMLVIEDQEIHLKSAKRLEALGHRVTYASTANEAAYHLGFSREKYFGLIEKPPYDVVLCDLEIPLGVPDYDLGIDFLDSLPEEDLYIHTQIEPLGYSIAFAAAKLRVPYIGILTDKNHHGGPVHACLDLLYLPGTNPGAYRPTFRVNDSTFLICDLRDTLPYLYLSSEGEIFEDSSRVSEDTREIKNWPRLLEMLLRN